MTTAVVTRDQLLALRREGNPRDVPHELRNFQLYLTKPPQLAAALQLVVHEDGMIKINPREFDETRATLRKLKAILNRVTDSNYDKLMEQARAFKGLSEPAILAQVVDIMLYNIKASPGFVPLYARMAKDVHAEALWPGFVPGLSASCRTAFEAFQAPAARAEVAAALAAISDTDERYELHARTKRQAKAVTCFLAHLYMVDLAPAPVPQLACLLAPFGPDGAVDELNLDCFLDAFPVCMHALYKRARADFHGLNRRLRALVAGDELGFRLKFVAQEFLRTNKVPDSPPEAAQ